MRELLERLQAEIVERFAGALDDKAATLELHDALSNMIDAAESFEGDVVVEGEKTAIVQVASVSLLRDLLNECLSNALMPFLTPDPTPIKKAVRKRSAVSVAHATNRKPAKRTTRKTARKKR